MNILDIYKNIETIDYYYCDILSKVFFYGYAAKGKTYLTKEEYKLMSSVPRIKIVFIRNGVCSLKTFNERRKNIEYNNNRKSNV